MIWCIAALFALLTFAVGVFSYSYIIIMKEEMTTEAASDTADAMPESKGNIRSILKRMGAAFMPCHVSKLSVSNWCVAAVASLAGAAAAIRLELWGADTLLVTVKLSLMAIVMLCVLIFDSQLKIIPNALVVMLLLIRLIWFVPEYLLCEKNEFKSLLLFSVIGLVICLATTLLLARITHGGIGMGDVKILSALGWALGLLGALYAILYCSLVSVIVSIILLMFKKKKWKDHIPFGPFIYCGFMIMMFLCNF